MWPSRGRPRGGPRLSDLQRAPAYPVTPDRPKVSLEVMNIDGMTLCEREARGERAQSRRMALPPALESPLFADAEQLFLSPTILSECVRRPHAMSITHSEPSPSTRNPRVGRSLSVDSPVQEREGHCRMLAGSGASQSSPGDKSARTAQAWQAGGPGHRSVLAGQHEHRNLSRGLGLGFAELRILREQLRPQLGAVSVVELLR